MLAFAIVFVLVVTVLIDSHFVAKTYVLRAMEEKERQISSIKDDIERLGRFQRADHNVLWLKYRYLKPVPDEKDGSYYVYSDSIVDTPEGKMFMAEEWVGPEKAIQSILSHLGMKLAPGEICGPSPATPILVPDPLLPPQPPRPTLHRSRK